MGFLRRLREMADEHAAEFSSPGFTRFFAMLGESSSEDYLAEVEDHLRTLKFKGGMLISAQLGRRQQGQGLQAPAASRAEQARADVRSLGLQLHDSRT